MNECSEQIAFLEKRINEIDKRNRTVEADKAWETSRIRKVILLLFTYISIGLYLQVIEVNKPWLNAIVPALGFFLSTLTMPYFKLIWIGYFYTPSKKNV